MKASCCFSIQPSPVSSGRRVDAYTDRRKSPSSGRRASHIYTAKPDASTVMNTDMLGDAGGRDGAFGQGEFRAEAGEYQLAAVDGRTGVGDPADMGVQHAERLEHVCLGPRSPLASWSSCSARATPASAGIASREKVTASQWLARICVRRLPLWRALVMARSRATWLAGMSPSQNRSLPAASPVPPVLARGRARSPQAPGRAVARSGCSRDHSSAARKLSCSRTSTTSLRSRSARPRNAAACRCRAAWPPRRQPRR